MEEGSTHLLHSDDGLEFVRAIAKVSESIYSYGGTKRDADKAAYIMACHKLCSPENTALKKRGLLGNTFKKIRFKRIAKKNSKVSIAIRLKEAEEEKHSNLYLSTSEDNSNSSHESSFKRKEGAETSEDDNIIASRNSDRVIIAATEKNKDQRKDVSPDKRISVHTEDNSTSTIGLATPKTILEKTFFDKSQSLLWASIHEKEARIKSDINYLPDQLETSMEVKERNNDEGIISSSGHHGTKPFQDILEKKSSDETITSNMHPDESRTCNEGENISDRNNCETLSKMNFHRSQSQGDVSEQIDLPQSWTDDGTTQSIQSTGTEERKPFQDNSENEPCIETVLTSTIDSNAGNRLSLPSQGVRICYDGCDSRNEEKNIPYVECCKTLQEAHAHTVSLSDGEVVEGCNASSNDEEVTKITSSPGSLDKKCLQGEYDGRNTRNEEKNISYVECCETFPEAQAHTVSLSDGEISEGSSTRSNDEVAKITSSPGSLDKKCLQDDIVSTSIMDIGICSQPSCPSLASNNCFQKADSMNEKIIPQGHHETFSTASPLDSEVSGYRILVNEEGVPLAWADRARSTYHGTSSKNRLKRISYNQNNYKWKCSDEASYASSYQSNEDKRDDCILCNTTYEEKKSAEKGSATSSNISAVICYDHLRIEQARDQHLFKNNISINGDDPNGNYSDISSQSSTDRSFQSNKMTVMVFKGDTKPSVGCYDKTKRKGNRSTREMCDLRAAL